MKRKNPIVLLKRGDFWGAIAAFFLLLFGIMGTMFASLGICIFCILPVLTFLLSIFGLSVGTISDYNWWFLGFGIFFLVLTIYLIIRKRRCKTCNIIK
jgi:hypothetical protein